MKMSFSLSSLQPSSDSLERAEHTRIRADRPYNSLTKKRKEPMQDQGTKNWSGPEDGKDDFWAAIRTNYDYIMDTNLIDTCKETNGELAWDEGDVSTVSWGLKEVSCQFSELYSWLRVLQELVYSKEENVLDKSLRAAHTEELRRKAYRKRLFNEQAEKLIARAPSLKEEVSWRVDHLNAKWDLVEQIMAPVQRPDELDNQDVSADFEHEVKCLRKWLREMETRLQPLNFRVDWNRTEIEEKAMEHMVLQRDIESHGRIVSSIVKLGERVAGRNQCSDQAAAAAAAAADEHQQQQQQQALRVASSLERRWHLLFLRSLEWQCHIEALAARVCTKLSASRCSSDSDDEEPVTKQPRLSRRVSTPLSTTQSSSSSCPSSSSSSQDESSAGTCSRRRSSVRARRQLRARFSQQAPSAQQQQQSQASASHASDQRPAATSSSSSDSDVSSENRFVDDGSYFEDDLDVLCVVSVKAEDFSNQTKLYAGKRRPRNAFGDQGTEADIEEADLSEEEEDKRETTKQNIANMTPTPDQLQTTPIDESRDEIDVACTTASVAERTKSDSTPANESPKRRRTEAEAAAAIFHTSNRKSKNCATFYFRHMDTDSESEDKRPPRRDQQQSEDRGIVESSEEEWTFTSARMDAQQQQQQQQQHKNSYGAKMRLNFDAATDALNDNDCTNMDVLNGNVVHNINIEENDQPTASNGSDDEYNNQESIKRLIREVEVLVHQEGKHKRNVPPLIFDEEKGLLSSQNHKAKYARIKEWLALNSALCVEGSNTLQYCQLTVSEALDSCDASGEYTTGESDVEKQSEISEEDLHSSVVTCRLASQSNSEELLEDRQSPMVKERSPVPQHKLAETSTPKVVLRSKRKSHTSPRPWSVSCITQIRKRASLEINVQEPISQFSISETALHQLVAGPPAKSASLDATESRAPFNNSTTTLLEETIIGQDARVVRNSSLRRKKNRLRKKNASRRSESGSDGMNATNHRSEGSDELSSGYNPRSARKSSTGSRQSRSSRTALNVSTTNLVKSGSFSGYTGLHECEAVQCTSVSDKLKTTTPSESEEEKEELAGRTSLRNGRGCTMLKGILLVGNLNAGDSDIEKHSLSNNSFSEQAWDNYLEKYMSEPYSEAADTDTARRLLDFGDDYRNFLDSQSDCASSLGAVRYQKSSTVVTDESDSDSEFKRLAETSRKQLLLSEARCNTMADGSFNELARICRENIRCLQTISETSGGSRRSDKHAKQIRGLMERWESLSLRAEESQKINAIHREVAALKLEFCAAHERLASYQVVLEEPHIIEDRINRITNELANLRDRKSAMLALNVSTHRLITDLGQKTSPTFSTLKDGIADLYRLWDEAFQRGNQQLSAFQAVQQFGQRLTELQCALRRDKDTLAVLDAALQAGATMEVASSVRDVARLLSEKHETNNQSAMLTDAALTISSNDDSGNGTQTSFNDSTPSPTCSLVGLEGGSLSDSGISDSGSEQELSERERRLAALRRLTRTLESQLVPNTSDQVLTELWHRVEEAEAELRNLQSQCRELIVRTAASVESRTNVRPDSTTVYPVPSKRKKTPVIETPVPNEKVRVEKLANYVTAAGDPEKDPHVPRSWVWRILRAALPFQLAIVVLFCAACLLEPSCCEAGNSLNLSLTPQLRYVRGPPPV
ncbi:klarsicht protein [Phymastichus coffea]|uniref:klarsicht protein n=1 Tax=Phymastichus coffea TaxID=108790 RepID=UPI00273BB8E6|nr:klarsicht protein [Phymastichus coffea]